jgi:hypothetical protein
MTIDELLQRRKTLHVSMCDNLMSEAELTVMEKARSSCDAARTTRARDVRWDELKQAVEAAVQAGQDVMDMQERRSVEEFNDDSEYSKMLLGAVQVRAQPLPACLVGAGVDIDATSNN